MKKFLSWAFAAALICSSTVFTSCVNEDNPVNPADNLAEKIKGKWIFAERNGEPTPTNKKRVFNIVSETKAYVSASRGAEPTMAMKWLDHTEADVVINGNKMTLTMQADEHTTVEDEFIIINIDDTEFTANLKVSVTVDGTKEKVSENILCLKKLARDYSETILGTWEGHVTNSEGSEYDDGKVHRWEYKADGTYVYYSLDEAGEWVSSENDLNEYFVDGTLLCTRWIDNDEEFREWWEIAYLKGDKMQWKALRQNEDGSTYTATFEMKKVE